MNAPDMSWMYISRKARSDLEIIFPAVGGHRLSASSLLDACPAPPFEQHPELSLRSNHRRSSTTSVVNKTPHIHQTSATVFALACVLGNEPGQEIRPPGRRPKQSSEGCCRVFANLPLLNPVRVGLQNAQRNDCRLIPKDVEWASFCRFISELNHVKDSAVSGRYCYGELRLTRLKF